MKCTIKIIATTLAVSITIFALNTLAQETVPGFVLRSPEVADGGILPKDYTGDGSSATLPLEWSGVPEGTKSFALIMHHIAPDQTKWYWILYNIPATTLSLPRNVKDVGTLGNNSVNGKTEYAPPHSKGPGPKKYIYTVYALSAIPQLDVKPDKVSRDVLLAAMKDHILGSAELKVVYSRGDEPGKDEAPPAFPPGDKKFERRNGEKEGSKDRPYPPPKQAWKVACIILGCPERDKVSMGIRPYKDMECVVKYGTTGGSFGKKTETLKLKSMASVELTLTGLTADAEYEYRLNYHYPGENEFQNGPTYRFHTQRMPGDSFIFEIQGDSHPERTPKENDPVLYEQTLLAVAKDRPDFFMCIGDDFSVDTLSDVNASSVEHVYLKQLPYLGLVAHSSPLFLVNGNHEQAALCNLNGTADNVAVWAQNCRNKYFPQPAPDGFYSGDTKEVEHIGLLHDYYAWTWGDALFVVIDPYWHSKSPVDNVFGGEKEKRDLWDITLGDAQYQWLKKTLEESRAKFKFVFAHHVNGTGRGGIENAGLYEWGGKGAGGASEFNSNRSGWEMPIHQLMAKNCVTIFFQGHDHIFARQEKDGVTYQTLPEPADPNYSLFNKEAYRSGDIFPNSGRVRVSVNPEKVRVEYVRSFLPNDTTKENPDGKIAFTYEIPANKK